jgi:serine protease inhibitor
MRRWKVITVLAIAVVIITNIGCAGKKPIETYNIHKIEAKPLASPVDKISVANNKLAFKFLNATIKSNAKDDIVISPLSLTTVLALTQNGAAGNTKEEMLKVLELKGCDNNTINESYKNIIANFNSLKGIETKMADSVWIKKGLQVKEEVKNIGRNYFEADVNEVDFSKKETIDTINNWVSERTAGKIKKIMDSTDDTAMALINTLYFKGKWREPFNDRFTSKQNFTSSEGDVKKIDMMSGRLEVEYLRGSNFEAVRLPYEDNNFGMYIFLPSRGTNINAFMKDMNYDSWNKYMNEFTSKQVMVKLPRFKIEYEQKLNDMLSGMGMKAAFQDNADFSNITDKKNLYISMVKQKCYIDVNEAGTEAAAATIVEMKVTSMIIDHPIEFTADRPFMYAIADKKTGLLMFMGKFEE